MKDNEALEHLMSAYPVVKSGECAKQNTIKVATDLLLQQTKYTCGKGYFVMNQLKSISKMFWLIQVACFLMFIANFTTVEKLEDIQIFFLTIVPVMTFYVLPELSKTQFYNMMEIEAVCFFSPIKTLAAKMALISSCNLVMIAIMSVTFGIYRQLDILELLCRGLIPFNISVALTILLFDFIKITSPYAMLSVSAMLTLLVIQMHNFCFLLNHIWLSVFSASVLLMLLVIGVTAIRFKRMEEHCYGT